MSFQPTEEQLSIVEAARETADNLIISALAGAAKTSTLVLIGEALSKTSILCISFNKRIADEMKTRLPANCTSMTLNSLGHRVWADTIGKRLHVDAKKNYKIVSEIIENWEDADERGKLFESFSEILKAVEAGKTCGYVPTGEFPNAKPLMDDHEFFDEWLDPIPTDSERTVIREASLRSIRLGREGTIDFSDQLLLPTVFPSSFPQYPLVLIDEAQDLSALNHRMIQKFAKKRLIAVGDECQSIYGFRGAHQDSMNLLRKTFSMRQLLLTISFRCPISIVGAALWRAPLMRYPSWAKQGVVQALDSWSADDLPPEAVIICRNNAPLFAQAIRLIKSKRYPQLVGNDIGKNLLKIMRKFGKDDLPIEEAEKKLDRWVRGRLKKARDHGPVHDQADCIRVFFEEAETLGEAMTRAEDLFNMSGPIKLMTGHKAKGLEFDHVFFLNEELCSDRQQDRNLRYVIITRAKESLTYVTSEGWR